MIDKSGKIRFLAPKNILWRQGGTENEALLLKNCGKFQTLWKKELFKLDTQSSILLDFGVELQGSIRLVLGRCSPTGYTGERPYKIRIRMGESVSEAMNTPVNHHTMHDAEILLAPMGETVFGKSGFRFVRIDNLEDIALNFYEISAMKFLPPVSRIGYLKCADEVLNDIFEAAGRTVDNCIDTLIMDGAKRDRLVWMGDLFAEIRALSVFYEDHPAIKKTMEFMLDEAKESVFFNRMQPYTPYFFLALREYLKFVPAVEWIKSLEKDITSAALKMLAEWSEKKDLVLQGGIIDWSEETGQAPGGYAALLAWGVKSCSKIAEVLENQELQAHCQRVYDEIKSEFKLTSASKSIAAFAVLSDLSDPQEVFRNILSAAPEKGLSTFHMDNILSAWSQAGRSQEALALLKRYYGGMLELGSTTFWEQFELEYLDNAGRIDQLPVDGKRDVHKECGRGCFAGYRHSFCHGWGAAPAAWMSEKMLGISPCGNEFKSVLIQKESFYKDDIEGVFPTPYGGIFIKRSKGLIEILEVPENMEYSIV